MTDEKPQRSMMSLMLVLLLFGAPTFGALFLVMNPEYLPDSTKNNGELIQQVALPKSDFKTIDNSAFSVEEISGNWALLTFIGNNCDQSCAKTLYNVRQVRKTTANSRKYVSRIAMLTDDQVEASLTDELLSEHKGLFFIRNDKNVQHVITGLNETPESIKQKVYLVDPRNNIMMSYTADQPPEDIIKDFELLLKAFPVN
ncbi:MAG: hypothetical protein HOM11_12770 [Methylococcales bacterium]|jgi:cytochrome oxidase Cu insertion factor (SCO1/SenC/PrrC family)|nr:hypothetical protein [Methylococcales bacterium]MBT7445784.1 hypothetical protein [Methylococcales bacterium]